MLPRKWCSEPCLQYIFALKYYQTGAGGPKYETTQLGTFPKCNANIVSTILKNTKNTKTKTTLHWDLDFHSQQAVKSLKEQELHFSG